jgi:hypothetical protein
MKIKKLKEKGLKVRLEKILVSNQIHDNFYFNLKIYFIYFLVIVFERREKVA